MKAYDPRFLRAALCTVWLTTPLLGQADTTLLLGSTPKIAFINKSALVGFEKTTQINNLSYSASSPAEIGLVTENRFGKIRFRPVEMTIGSAEPELLKQLINQTIFSSVCFVEVKTGEGRKPETVQETRLGDAKITNITPVLTENGLVQNVTFAYDKLFTLAIAFDPQTGAKNGETKACFDAKDNESCSDVKACSLN